MYNTACLNHNLFCEFHDLACVSVPPKLFRINAGRDGYFGGKWYFMTLPLPNGRYLIKYLSGAISFIAGGWLGGNCIFYDGILEPTRSLPPDYEFLPGSQTGDSSREAAENAGKGKTGIYTIKNGGISACFLDTNTSDNYGQIIYGYKRLKEENT